MLRVIQTNPEGEKPTVRKRILGKATRDAYGEVLAELGKENPNIVVLDADLSKSTKSNLFGKAFPKRFFNFGICEANMVSAAAGLASAGKIPFASSFASFLLCKGFDQARMGIANPHLNVKLVGSHGGVSLGEDGASQQSVEDFALALALPKLMVINPADEMSTKALTRQISNLIGPVYMRTGRPKAPVIYSSADKITLGKAAVLKEGNDATIFATGLMVAEALEAADILGLDGKNVGVIDIHTLRPIDENAIFTAARNSKAFVVAEEHLLHGGLGATIAQVVSTFFPVPIEFVGIKDSYGESGTPPELFEKFALNASAIVQAVEKVINRKD
ncbi:MAG: transketolase family protein [Nitrospirae bacterium]|nr:transketolase family protein [Nitrospirota bacterium]